MRRDVFQAIADPVRREIIDLLSSETMTVNKITENFDISRPAVSRHLKILQECGIITMEQKGRERFCKIEPSQLVPAFMWLDQYRQLWESRLDNFENYLAKLQTNQKQDE